MTKKKRLFIILAIVLAVLIAVSVALAVVFIGRNNTPEGPGGEISGNEQGGGSQGGSGNEQGGGSQGGSGNEQGGGSQGGSGNQQGGTQGGAHVHSLQKHEEKEPTCAEDGNILYYECESCHDLFLDEAGKEPTTKAAVTKNATSHKAEEEWVKDGTSHWHNCEVCGQKVPESEVAHSYAGEWQTDAVSHWKECNVCGYVNKSKHEFGENDFCGVCNEKRKDPSEGLRYTLNEDQISYSVTGIGSCKDTDIVIPETHDDKSVTSIGENAFLDCDRLISVVIPDSVTSIGIRAFAYCDGLTSITIPDSVTSIGDSAFFSCRGLTSVIIPASVITIGDYAFEVCVGLTSINIPDSVTSIGDSAFSSCSKLTSVVIPGSGVTSIGDSAFYYCWALNSITIGSGVTSIGRDVFVGCSSLASVVIPDSVTSIGDSAFRSSGLTSITIGRGVTSIGKDVFSACTVLMKINVDTNNQNYHSKNNCLIETASKTLIAGCMTSIIPDDGSVTSIGDAAFYGCRELTSINIPDSVTSIGYAAFTNCARLTEIKVDEKNQTYHVKDNCLIETKSKTLVAGCNTSKIPNDGSVTSIGDYAFNGRRELTSIDIPDSVTSIGNWAFSGCSGLTSVVIPGSVTSIGDYAFYYCEGLTSITIPGSVTSIGNWAFSVCNLEKVHFENPNGWKVSKDKDMSNAQAISGLDDPTTAANYLTKEYGYYDYYWKREG